MARSTAAYVYTLCPSTSSPDTGCKLVTVIKKPNCVILFVMLRAYKRERVTDLNSRLASNILSLSST